MPGNLHFFDTTLPRAADANGKSAEEQLAGIYNYLYMLLEQLRYTLANLDGSNINSAALSGFQKLITEPINVRLEDAEGNIHTLTITAGELSSRISAEVQRAGGVEQSLYSSILQTASAITAEVSRATIAEGALDQRATQIEQTADDLTLKITVNGGVTTYSFEANGVQIGNSLRQVELYSLTGELPPVGVVGGVYVNALGQNVLEHGWYAAYDSSWTGQNAVYCCATFNGGANWGAVYIKSGVAGRQGYDGLSVVLNNNPHVFAGSESAAVASQAQVGVIAFLGSVRQAVTINSVTGAPTGMSYTIADNGTQNARVIVSVTTALTTQSGELSVNVTVGQQTFTLPWSWSVAYKGAQGAQGVPGQPGSDANVTFANVNNALANIFRQVVGGVPTFINDFQIYSPVIEGGVIRGTEIYAGQGSGFSKMSTTGLDVYTAGGAKKIGMGYNTTNDTDYPYIMLGQGTGYSGGGAAIVQKLGAGIWIGDDSIVAAGGSYPGNRNSAQDISGSYPHATGLFVDFSGDTIYKYLNGVPSQIGAATFLD